MKALPMLLAALAVACRSVIAPDVTPTSTLTVEVSAYRWGDTIKINNSFENETGFAGLELEVTDAADGVVRTHRFDASDLAGGVTPYEVPDTGIASAKVRLTQQGQVVATGIAEWHLRPGIAWTIQLERSPYPHERGISPTDDLTKAEYLCGWRGCHHIWRFDISDHAANYPGESLWLTLLAFADCPEGFACG